MILRLYLDILPNDGDEGVNKFDMTRTRMLQSPEMMKKYSEWLETNHEELEIMKNLDNFYVAKVIEFSDDEKNGWKIKYPTTNSKRKPAA